MARAAWEVYLAQDTKLDRKVALKILLEDLASDAERMRRFVQEAKAASALNHPNIITIHEIGEAEGAHFIATEFIGGPTLRERLDRGPLPLDELLGIAGQTAEALTCLLSDGTKPAPEGVEFDGESFGTPVTSFAFKWLQPTSVRNSSLASQSIPSWKPDYLLAARDGNSPPNGPLSPQDRVFPAC